MSDLFEKGQIVWDNANTLCSGFKVAETPCENSGKLFRNLICNSLPIRQFVGRLYIPIFSSDPLKS